MKINTGCYLKKGYTLVEVLTASGIFSILLVAVFQFYRMGSLMFNSGSWRQSAQKKAEQFTYLLEKRMNRISIPAVITRNPSTGLTTFNEGTITICCVNGNQTIRRNQLPKTLLAFPVCKSSIEGNNGVIMYHVLRAVPHKTPSINNLCRLEFLATTNLNNVFNFASNLRSYNLANVANMANNFQGSPAQFDLGQNNTTTYLDDVSDLNITYSTNIDVATCPLIINIQGECAYPKKNSAKIKFQASASILKDNNIRVETLP